MTSRKEIDELAHNIFNKRIELFDLTKNQICCGRVESVGLASFKFIDDTGETRYYNYNDVEIKA